MVKLALWIGALILIFMGVVWWQWPDEYLRFRMCDVGQGDAALVTIGFTQVLIDGGPPNGRVLECLGKSVPFWDRTLEVVMVSHTDADHIGGIVEVVKRYKVGHLLVSGVVGQGSEHFDQLKQELLRRDIAVTELGRGEVVRIGRELVWRTVWPALDDIGVLEEDGGETAVLAEATKEGVNDYSLVGLLQYQDLDILFTGDISVGVEQKLLEAGLLHEVELVKMPHHGSRTSSSQELIDQVRSDWVVIGVGAHNRFGHPVDEVVKRWEEAGSVVARTDTEGLVRFVYTDGKLVREE